MRIISESTTAPGHLVPHHVERWYNRSARCWVIALHDVYDNQIDDAIYVHSKREAIAEELRVRKENNL